MSPQQGKDHHIRHGKVTTFHIDLPSKAKEKTCRSFATPGSGGESQRVNRISLEVRAARDLRNKGVPGRGKGGYGIALLGLNHSRSITGSGDCI